MEVFFATLVGFGIAYAIGNRLVTTTKHLKHIMAAIDDLEANILTANLQLEELQGDVDRIIAAQDPALQTRIADAANAVKALGNANAELSTRIDQAVPPATP